ncbi:MAG: hypothetical protein IJJ26_08095, partial [Victivallales bacterium]|nr:hypothetical protein [Victivallales bacterium]
CKVVNEYKRKYKEEGRAEGITQGRAEGITQGRAEGITQGRAEGITQGRELTVREIVTNLLKMRFSLPDIKKATKATDQLIQEIALSLGL